MKQIISLFLIVCFAFFSGNTTSLTNFQSDDNESLVLDLLSVSDFSFELESENIDVSNADAYEISVLIELDKERPNFNAINISAGTDDIDAELEAHRNRVKEYYVEYNENVVATLGLYDYEYYVSYYSPYIEIVFDDIAEYSNPN